MNIKKNWKKLWSKRLTLRLLDLWTSVHDTFPKYFDIPFPDLLVTLENEIGTGYMPEDQYGETIRQCIERICNESFQTFFENRGLQVFDSFKTYTQELGKQDFSKLTNKKILNIWQDFVDREFDWMQYIYMIFLLDEGLTQELINTFKGCFGKSYQKKLDLILASPGDTAAVQYEREVLNLAVKYSDISEAEREANIKKIAKIFAFFPVYTIDTEPLDVSVVKESVQNILDDPNRNPAEEIEHNKKKERQDLQNYENFKKENRKNTKLLNIAEAGRRVAFLREYRNDVRQQAHYAIRPLFQEISKRLDLSLTNLLYLSNKELSLSLKNEKCLISQKTIEERKKIFVIKVLDSKREFIFDKNQAKKVIEQELSSRKTDDVIRGTPAFPGVIQGTARVIKNVTKEGSGFKIGEILVTQITNLAFMPVMAKASAFVTDGGGILSHPAIVAREMKKPCVVGTQEATSLIKTGDTIEVNANDGIVRKID